MRRSAPVVVLAALALLAGCTAGSPDAGGGPAPATPPEIASPLDDCAALTAPPPEAPAPEAGDGAGDNRDALPELSLPCFTGDQPVALSELRGPAVVNLWASWCGPCREELPVLQTFADDTADRVHVVGVITRDRRTAASAFAADAGVSFPGLYDREQHLFSALPGLPELGLPAPPALGLPVTLFVNADGSIVHAHPEPVDAEQLAQLAAEHLGVTR